MCSIFKDWGSLKIVYDGGSVFLILLLLTGLSFFLQEGLELLLK